MRVLVLFALPIVLAAQPAESGDKVTQALISEIQQLRLAIERSTLLNARTQLAISQMRSALTLLRHSVLCHWQPPVLAVSATRGEGIENFWDSILQHREMLSTSGQLTEKRRKQALDWMWKLIDLNLQKRFHNHNAVQAALPEQISAVAAGATTPTAAAAFLLDKL